MDIDTPPNPEISFQTVLDAVNRQSQEIEANHKYTHLLQIYVDFSCTDLSHGFHHVNLRHDLLRYFCINFIVKDRLKANILLDRYRCLRIYY
jgi:hypothetical protein